MVEEKITLKVYRFDPTVDEKPTYVEYKVPKWTDMKVLEALRYIYENYEPIAFRYGCRAMLCGVCTLTINGEPRLACATDVENGMIIEPLKGFPIIKDLIVDYGKALEKLKRMKLFLVTDEASAEAIITKDIIDNCKQYSYCIACSACLSACPSVQHAENKFVGPLFSYFLCRYIFDPRDKADRVEQAFSEGIYECLSCYRCEEVCPYDIPVNEVAIDMLRRKCFERGMSPKYVKEFVEMVNREAFINSSKLILRTKGLEALKDLGWVIRIVVKRKLASPFKKYDQGLDFLISKILYEGEKR